MAQFIGYLKQGQIQRLGSKSSGMTAEVCGQKIGGLVEIRYDEDTKQDILVFTLNRGSSSGSNIKTLVFKESELSD